MIYFKVGERKNINLKAFGTDKTIKVGLINLYGRYVIL